MVLQVSWFLLFSLVAHFCTSTATSTNGTFLFNGFHHAGLNLSGSATVTGKGALQLTNGTSKPNLPGILGHAFFPAALPFKNLSANATKSFSTRFVFEIVSDELESGGDGMAFTVAPSTNFSAVGGRFLGLFNTTNYGMSENHIFAVEFDTSQQSNFRDIDANHVGVDLNSVISTNSASAAYFTELGRMQRVVLDSRTLIQAWIEYDGHGKHLNVTIAPESYKLKPNRSLISSHIDLSPVLQEYMYVGFSSGTQKLTSKHYILAWSFAVDGRAPDLDLSHLPSIPRDHTTPWKSFKLFLFISASLLVLLFIVTAAILFFLAQRKRKLTCEKIEGWEVDYPHRFPYRELYQATKGFKQELGKGGFGSVYKGVLKSGTEVAVKRVSNSSKGGMRQFVAEVSSLGRMKHRNLVQLLGWCRRCEDLLLVYEFMPNGSLDSLLFDVSEKTLDWEQRFNILKGIAHGLLYLHDEWEQVVVHRDVKAGNVLLDDDLNGRLGDFGLARLYQHGGDPKTTKIVGSFGYMAPELSRTSKSTTSSDVYAYGAFLLEVACGRRPIQPESPWNEIILVDLVHSLWKEGRILDAMDKRLGNSYVEEEAELVLKLGVLCSQAAPELRPSMRQLTRFLNGDATLQDLDCHRLVIQDGTAMNQLLLQHSSSENAFTTSGNSGRS
ncbi:unnamed protein product [Victoria cruziana]